ncbi:hypothetical protein THAOC_12825 [Thalassiosira oceanica]|uniref:Uncharacterized protein n=1 Tax=Thalassiosira oceanica TaxID=159749 RepID=K0SLT0_THAOC|nr:hypothetical protein THAOC_12825 [Thalassiosira oceanica]|eukprot:EJK66265.1 hypothetical protein THAOC_12825 [Thalassiosira oceanica]
MHHDRRPAALILLGVTTETDALHLPVLVTNLKCALECSWQDPARLHPGPGGLVLADAAALLQSKRFKIPRANWPVVAPRFEISRLGGGYLAWADPVWSIPVFLPHVPRGLYRSSGVTGVVLSDVVMILTLAFHVVNACVLQELERVGEVVGCRMLCFSTPDDLESCVEYIAVPSLRSQHRLSDGTSSMVELASCRTMRNPPRPGAGPWPIFAGGLPQNQPGRNSKGSNLVAVRTARLAGGPGPLSRYTILEPTFLHVTSSPDLVCVIRAIPV